MHHRNVGGPLLLVGSTQFIISMIVAESVYPGYSISLNYISDLGVGPTAAIFNFSAFLLGLMTVVSAYFMHREFQNVVFTAFIGLAGIGAMAVGIFPETTGLPHALAAIITFLFGGLAAITAYKLEKKPLNYFSVALGIVSLTALILSLGNASLGLGKGGMERMIAYPVLVWESAFGGHMINAR
ncbi:MAG: DUF998 domain-containing protein [Candidatus Bathyarchaeota archaeon]|nr:DUF998 domain-containing protein [Candidatus Bathyarchaeota archaeon]